MKLINFEIEDDYITLSYNGRYLDIHNCFNFVELVNDQFNKQAKLVFQANENDCIAESIHGFSLLFEGITAICEKNDNSDSPTEYLDQDKMCVDLLGFAYDEESFDGVSTHIGGEGLNSLIFVFVTGAAIKITASQVSFQLAD